MKTLIVNADDFGYTPGVSLGIIEAHNKGIVTSTTALSVSEYFLEGMELARVLAPTLGIGLHLTLTLRHAKPLLPKEMVPSLVDETGCFWNQSNFLEHVKPAEVKLEWEAQILRFLDSGRKPDHLDSHHYVHGKSKALFDIALELAEKYQIPIRNCSTEPEFQEFAADIPDYLTTDWMFLDFYGENATLETLEKVFKTINESPLKTFELGCHPAFLDYQLPPVSSYANERVNELQILTSEAVKQALKNSTIVLTNYQAIR